MRPVATLSLFLAVLAVGGVLVGAERPGVGDKAPDFSLPSLAGESVRLSEITEKGPVVLVVLRGYPGYQCPICNRQVQEFLHSARGFSEAGAQVLMVYPGPDEDDRDGAIFFARISDSHGGRTTAAEVLDALKQKSQQR